MNIRKISILLIAVFVICRANSCFDSKSDPCDLHEFIVVIEKINTGNPDVFRLEAVTTAGKEPIRFEWSTGDETQVIHVDSGLEATYTVTATDANGCKAIFHYKIK